MNMKNRIILIVVALLLTVVFVSFIASEMSWRSKENTTDPLRQTMGLPSIAVGNLSPTARNPGLELFCTGLYDTPGGYCSYFTNGVPFINFPSEGNVTLVENVK
jgi:hypothetical protein